MSYRKTNTLREVAQMLYDADPSVSTPLALHAFRRIHLGGRTGDLDATPIGVGVTRVPLDSVTALLLELDEPPQDKMDVDTADRPEASDHTKSNVRTSSLLGWNLLRDEIDESAAALNLGQIGLGGDKDILDCVVKPDPTLSLAPKPSRSTGRERSFPPDRYARSRR